MKDCGIQQGGNDVVKGVCTRSDAESPYCKEGRKVHPGHRSKEECPHTKLRILFKMSIHEDHVVMRTEQRR